MQALIFLAALTLIGIPAAWAQEEDTPLFLGESQAQEKEAVEPINVKQLKQEAESLARKAKLLKEAADKKYAQSAALREKAGGYRSEYSRRGEELQGRANRSASTANFLGSMFNVLSQAQGMSGYTSYSPESSLAQSFSANMVQNQQANAMAQKGAADMASAKYETEADRKAGPIEQEADEIDKNANKLMDAYNKVQSLANARFLLVASEELRGKLDQDGRYLESLKKRVRGFLGEVAKR